MLGELIEQSSDAPPSRLEGPLGRLSHEMFELGEHLLDRVEVWAVGWQEDEPGALPANGGTDGVAPVAAEIVHDDDVAGFKRGGEELFDIALEAFAVDWPVEHAGCIDAVMAQGSKKGHRLPVAMRHASRESFAFHSPAAQRRHVGLRPRFIDEDQMSGVKPALVMLPSGAAPGDVRPLLFSRLNGLFMEWPAPQDSALEWRLNQEENKDEQGPHRRTWNRSR